MKHQDMLKLIGEKFPLIVRNQYHVQLRHDEGKYTNIWALKDGSLKVQLFGSLDKFVVYPRGMSELMKRLARFDYKSDGDLARMRELEGLMSKAKGKEGIYTDAGWKNGKARIAIIRIFGNDLDITVREGQYDTSFDAEMVAAKLARSLYPTAHTIYSDCLPVVDAYNKIHETNVMKWIERGENKEADKLSSLRGT